MINPFVTNKEKLVSLATGAVLENDVADHLLRAEEIDEEQIRHLFRRICFVRSQTYLRH